MAKKKLEGKQVKGKFGNHSISLPEIVEVTVKKPEPLTLSTIEWIFMLAVIILAIIGILWYGVQNIIQDAIIAENKIRIAQLKTELEESVLITHRKDIIISAKDKEIETQKSLFKDYYVLLDEQKNKLAEFKELFIEFAFDHGTDIFKLKELE